MYKDHPNLCIYQMTLLTDNIKINRRGQSKTVSIDLPSESNIVAHASVNYYKCITINYKI